MVLECMTKEKKGKQGGDFLYFYTTSLLPAPPSGNPTIIGAALTQHFLHNEAKWKVQINEDDAVIKIKSCSSYAFLNNEHCGY